MQGKIDDRDDKEQSQDSGSKVSTETVAHNISLVASLRNEFVDIKNFDSN